MNAQEFHATHPEIWHIISYPFYFLGQKWLNYAHLNVYAGLITSANIIYLTLKSKKFNSSTTRHLMYWTSFFPSFLLNDVVWRDPFGICLISFGIVFMTLSVNLYDKGFSFIFLGYASFMQRTMYLLLAGVSTLWKILTKTQNVELKILYVCLGAFMLFLLKDITDENISLEYTSSHVNAMSYLALPLKIIFGLIGPFPWTQFSQLVKVNPIFSFQLQDYIMGTFQLGYLIAIIAKWKRIDFRNMDIMTIMGLGIMLSGFISRQMRIVYISEGLLFTLPWFFSNIGYVYKKYIKISLDILIILNIIILFIGNMGIASLWK